MTTAPPRAPDATIHGGPAAPVTGRRLVRWVLRRQRRDVVAGALAGIVWMGAIALLPVALGHIVDTIVDDASATGVALAVALLVAAVATEAVAGVVRHRLAVTLYVRTAWYLELLVTRRVLDPRGGPAIDAGTVLSLATSDTQKVGAIADLMCRGSGAVVAFLAVGAGMLVTAPVLGLLVLLGLPLCLLPLVPLMRPYDRRSAEQQALLAEASSVAADTVTGLRAVKGLGGEAAVRSWFATATAAVRRSGVAVARLDAAWSSLGTAIPAVFLAAVLWLAGSQALAGEIGAGDLVTFTGLALFLAIPLSTLAETGDVWVTGLASAGRIAALLDRPVAVADAPNGRQPLDGSVTLDGIGHGPLTGVDLHVEGGLVGIATERPQADALLDVLGRRVAPTTGALFVGNVDAREVDLDHYRAHVVVERCRHPWLPVGSLAEAVSGDRDGVTRDDLASALHVAAADDLLARPDALDAAVGERGLRLSGGQRQRVALARAVATGAPVLVLDDPTGSLDAVTEQLAVERLAEARAGHATIIVSTAPTVLARCDRVLLMADGAVQADGRHADLLGRRDYAALVLGQT